MASNRREFIQTVGTGIAASGLASVSQAQAKRPNILFFFPDQHRFDWVGTNPGVPIPTPNFNRLAERGALFNRCYCASPLCAPSRACLASGKEYHRARVASNRIDYPLDQTTFYSLLRESGYHVMGCGKLDLHKGSDIWGADGKTLLPEWGFDDGIDNAGKWDAVRSARNNTPEPYTGYLRGQGWLQTHVDDMNNRHGKSYKGTLPTELAEEGYCDNWIARNGLDLIRHAPQGKPWFLQVNFAGPHDPVDITKRMDGECRNVDYPQPHNSTELDANTHNRHRQNYAAMITNIDRWLGVYINELQKRGELDNTLIVFSSDHGEMLGDHNLWAKSKPFESSVGVPLAMAGPGISSGIATDALVSLIDLTATFLDYAGLDVPSDMDGKTLRDIVQGKTKSHREYLLSGLYPWRLVMDGEYKLVEGYGDEKIRLYNLYDDPWEDHNLAERDPNRVKKMQELLKDCVVK